MNAKSLSLWKTKPFLDLIYMCSYQTSITSWIYFTKKRRKKNFSNKTDKKFYEPLEIKLEEWREKIPKRKYIVLFFPHFPDKQGKKNFNNCNVIKYQFLQHRLSVISTENIIIEAKCVAMDCIVFSSTFYDSSYHSTLYEIFPLVECFSVLSEM